MNGQRGMSTVGAVLLAATAGLLTATLMMDWMVVDVHVVDVSDHDDIQVDAPLHIKVPFPLLIANIATGFIPDEAFEEAHIPPEVKAQKELVLATVRALLDTPDAELVKVRTEDANVDIEADGDGNVSAGAQVIHLGSRGNIVVSEEDHLITTIGAEGLVIIHSPDATLVKVRCEDANVDIYKDGDTLRIAVDADDAVVRCNVPIDGILDALEDWDWETFDPQMVFDVLHAAENGDLVTVATKDGVRVAIKMW